MANSWLGRVYRADKFLFIILSLFFTLTIFANLIRLQTSPFFTWHMYAHAIPPQETYPYYEVRYNDGKLINLRHSWNEPEKAFLYYPLLQYLNTGRNHSMDPFQEYLESYWLKKHPVFRGIAAGLYPGPVELGKFPAWYKRWLSLQVGEPVSNILVLEKKVRFGVDGAPEETASDTVLNIP